MSGVSLVRSCLYVDDIQNMIIMRLIVELGKRLGDGIA